MKRHICEVPNKGAWALAWWYEEGFWFPKCGSSQKRAKNLSSCVFMEASVHNHDWPSHWPLVHQPPAPLPSLVVVMCGGVRKSPSLITRHSFHLYGFEAFSETVNEDQIYQEIHFSHLNDQIIFLISHYIVGNSCTWSDLLSFLFS